MANVVRGEQDVTVGGRVLTLSFSVATMAHLEAIFPGEYAEDLGKKLAESRGVTFKRIMLLAALRDHHAGEFDLNSAGEMFIADEANDVLLALWNCWATVWPTPKAEDANAQPDPQTPPAEAGDGTGPGSSPSGANSSLGPSKTTGARRRARSPSPSTAV